MTQVSTFGQDGTAIRRAPELQVPVGPPSVKELPYDYAVKFSLTGRPGNRLEEVINVSVEGAFVAVAMGYSFIPAPLRNRQADILRIEANVKTNLGNVTDPVLTALGNLGNDIFELVKDPRPLLQSMLVRLCGVHFKYSMIDSATGRELQNIAIHNVAGLGEPNGRRPFRPFAKPMLFMPRSTIRVVVEEVSEGALYGYEEPKGSGRYVTGQLYLVLHGYKILGYGVGTP